jgi:S-adenosylmethionine synthetase
MDHTPSDYTPYDLDAMADEALDRVCCRQSASVFGYACDETPDLMPLPIWLSHRFARALDSQSVRKDLPYLLPDSEAEVSVEYRSGKPHRIHGITLVATQTDAEAADLQRLRDDLRSAVVEPVLKKSKAKVDKKTEIFINPTGVRTGGGPLVHSGLTGRKTGMDTYGGFARQSGTALSGKDPMRIDRVGAYFARYAAKQVVAAGLARECEVQLSYSIGAAGPVSLRVLTFGSGKLEEKAIADRLQAVIDFRIGAMVRDLRLKTLSAGPSGFYRKLAVYGHMGREDVDAPWEKTDKVKALR